MSLKLIESSIAFQKVAYLFKQDIKSITVNPNQTLLYIQGFRKIVTLQLFSRLGNMKMLNVPFCYSGYLSYTGLLTCPVFMKTTKQFFTVDFGKSIYLWIFDQIGGWKNTQQLEGHKSGVTCLILNNDEDQLISGSMDKTIRFWNKEEHWQCKQTIIIGEDHFNDISLSLNQTETKLIAQGSWTRVIVLEFLKQEQIWSVIQEIKGEVGADLCFLNDKTFIIQSYKGNSITIYKQDELDLQFKQHKLIQLIQYMGHNRQFPIKYIQKQNLLLINTGKIVHLIKFTKKEEFKILQQIHFQGDGFATINDDSRYLISWEMNFMLSNEVKKIQIILFKQFDCYSYVFIFDKYIDIQIYFEFLQWKSLLISEESVYCKYSVILLLILPYSNTNLIQKQLFYLLFYKFL